MDKAQAIQAFWESFGLDAYNEESVPAIEDVQFPYITYDLVLDNFGHEVAMSAMLHYRDSSWRAINYKVADIESYIGRGGCVLHFDNGTCIIHRGQPFAQPRSDSSDNTIKQFLLNISCEYITE